MSWQASHLMLAKSVNHVSSRTPFALLPLLAALRESLVMDLPWLTDVLASCSCVTS
jgi:hypothetical protein